ncbi:MAG: hypothetical protein HYS23_00925 [Geobacter sp.]|nr:hypothetical protein [Geobacter sp.]
MHKRTKTRKITLFSIVMCFLPLPICFAQDADKALPAIMSQLPQRLLSRNPDYFSTPLPAERKKGDNKASENGWYMLILEGAVAGISNLVSAEKKKDCWARYPGKYVDQCLSADEWRTGKNADR